MSRSTEKICMFMPSAEGGHPRYVTELMTAIARERRCGVELLGSVNLLDEFSSDLYPVHRVLPALRPRKQFRMSVGWAINRVLHYPRQHHVLLRWLEQRPDITAVHLQEWTPWLASWLIRRIHQMGKRVYYTVHNIVPHSYPPMVPKPLMHHWLRTACRQCDGLFVHTQKLADQLAAFLDNRHPPIHVVPHGTWTIDAKFEPPPVEQRLAERRLLFFGTIRRNKGLDVLLRAMEHLPGYSLTIAGDPIEEAWYREQILPLVKQLRDSGVQIDLKDRFIAEEEIPQLFATHGALVLPYTPQFVAQSGVVFMAIAYQTPVIASEVGGLRELLREHPIGVTFDTLSPTVLADAVRRLHDKSTQFDLAERLRTARRRLSWQSAAIATLAGYSTASHTATIPNDCSIETTSAA